jgi:hypothetical protein
VPTSESSSADSTAGSYIESGHTDASDGVTVVGDNFLKPRCTASVGWLTLFN